MENSLKIEALQAKYYKEVMENKLTRYKHAVILLIGFVPLINLQSIEHFFLTIYQNHSSYSFIYMMTVQIVAVFWLFIQGESIFQRQSKQYLNSLSISKGIYFITDLKLLSLSNCLMLVVMLYAFIISMVDKKIGQNELIVSSLNFCIVLASYYNLQLIFLYKKYFLLTVWAGICSIYLLANTIHYSYHILIYQAISLLLNILIFFSIYLLADHFYFPTTSIKFKLSFLFLKLRIPIQTNIQFKYLFQVEFINSSMRIIGAIFFLVLSFPILLINTNNEFFIIISLLSQSTVALTLSGYLNVLNILHNKYNFYTKALSLPLRFWFVRDFVFVLFIFTVLELLYAIFLSIFYDFSIIIFLIQYLICTIQLGLLYYPQTKFSKNGTLVSIILSGLYIYFATKFLELWYLSLDPLKMV